MTIREAKLALRFTDISSGGDCTTDSNPKMFQHWALVVHFPRGKKTYLFEAWKNESNGLLQPTRAEGVGYQVFENATYIATTETSPKELLRKARQVSTGEYNILFNNCQTWLKEFVRLISLELSIWPSFDQNHADIWTKFNLESDIFRFFASWRNRESSWVKFKIFDSSSGFVIDGWWNTFNLHRSWPDWLQTLKHTTPPVALPSLP